MTLNQVEKICRYAIQEGKIPDEAKSYEFWIWLWLSLSHIQPKDDIERKMPFRCDPAENEACKKTECYLKGGECFCTANKEFEKKW